MYLVKTYGKKSGISGKGFFAGEFIPKGTIVFLYGITEKFYSREEIQSLPDSEKEQMLEKLFCYGVEDEYGNWQVTDTNPDLGDINHSCDANILSMFIDGIYCDIAVKDIQKDEEITIDYRLFYSSFPWKLECKCCSEKCCGVFGSSIEVDSKTREMWCSLIADAVKHIFDVKQPLFSKDNEEARALARALMRKKNPKVYPYTKFSLISEGEFCI